MFSALTALLAVFRMVVIPAQFQDTHFSCTETELENTVLRAQDYFNDQFGGQCEFSFDLAPSVTLPKDLSYYGANYSDRKDALLYEAVRDACLQSSEDIDFSVYDNDSDGEVDNVFILVAGMSEADGASSDCIWPQHGLLKDSGAELHLDGKTVNSFTVSCELASDEGSAPRPAGIGIFCHELAHSFGLKDLYDTDGSGSGGNAPGLWNTSLMDTGCKNADGMCPPNLNAIDYELLGAGVCDTLEIGDYTLEPVNRNGHYLIFETGNEGEYFLFECREASGWDAPLGQGGLLVYHIDMSEDSAGYSDYYGRELSAAERWELDQINCRPDRQCAEIVAADPSATDVSGLFFPREGVTNFGSETVPAFRGNDGSSSGFALLDIRRNQDGSVSFSVARPVVLDISGIFQDAAIISWEIDDRLADNQGFEVEWTDGEKRETRMLDSSERSFTVEGLTPQTRYRATVRLVVPDEQKFSMSANFTTKVYRKGTYPYIYLRGSDRNTDGTFVPGSKIPLRIFNATGMAEVRWFFDGSPVEAESDGYFTVRRSGTLCAEIYYEDGTEERIIKEIRTR